MAINWIGVLIAATCVLNTIGLIALTIRVRFLEKLQGELILQQLVEDVRYIEKNMNSMMNKENNYDAD